MKNFLIICILISYPVMSQHTTPKSAFLEKWSNSKEYLLAIAESMPEEHYVFKPTEREMDFKNQLLHICGNMRWLGTNYFSEETFDRKQFSENVPESKKEVILLLKESFDLVYDRIKTVDEDALKAEVDFFAGPKSRLQILNLLQDHVTHHRGQLIVYLNLNEIKPPRYVGW
ncbi:DinB family protein [Aquimarina sp. 2201CG14-23]|uniref:DinB family protein n=1 Tax=Aquimarina mycalae TaxID=3040073 RepID=UPI002477F135|nr:DinB family protein [Aquimarina sp. 2201CG14-23]MDH7447297.1 DinB family protein [Aquimarina sp. 2201CG14-23]